jgi:hypothetical protein
LSPAEINGLQLTLSFHWGGRRIAITNLAHGLRHTAVNCDLCCLDQLGCRAEEVADQFRSVSLLSRTDTALIKVVRRLNAICRQQEITLIHAHDAASQFVAMLLRCFRPTMKLIMTFHRSLGFESSRLLASARRAGTLLQMGE